MKLLNQEGFEYVAMKENATFLFARPSFVEGIARIFDFGGTLTEYNGSSSTLAADARALRCDWGATGDAICVAIKTVAAEENIRLRPRSRVQLRRSSARRTVRVNGKKLSGATTR